jgi:hypothetical protein
MLGEGYGRVFGRLGGMRADVNTVDSGTHGDPKPGEQSKHMKPFEGMQNLLPPRSENMRQVTSDFWAASRHHLTRDRVTRNGSTG